MSEDIGTRVARLVRERGWNQEDFARIAQLNRHTVRLLFGGGDRRPRNVTLRRCAQALGVSVSDLENQPLERLLARMRGGVEPDADVADALIERARVQSLVDWANANRPRAAALSPEEAEELLAMQAPGGRLARDGPEACVAFLERRRLMLARAREVAATEFGAALDAVVEALHARALRGRP